MNFNTAEILSGLQEGELVLVDQLERDRVHPGDRVRVELEKP
jgi:hypothetical protein